jgi:protein tyrosine phosphatase
MQLHMNKVSDIYTTVPTDSEMLDFLHVVLMNNGLVMVIAMLNIQHRVQLITNITQYITKQNVNLLLKKTKATFDFDQFLTSNFFIYYENMDQIMHKTLYTCFQRWDAKV